MNDELKATLAEGAVSVERAAKVLGLKRSAAYAAVARGEIPVLRYGRKLIRVPTSYLRQALAA